MATSLRALTPLVRPIARQYLGAAISSASAAYATRTFASKRNRHQQLNQLGQQPQQQAHQASQSASSAGSADSATDGPESSQPAREPYTPTDVPITPPEPLSQALSSSSLPSLDFSPDSPAPGRTGARSAQAKDGPTESQKRFGRILTFLFAVGAGATVWHLGREWDEEELGRRRKSALPMGTGISGFGQRLWHRGGETVGLFREPAWEELLPPPLPAPHQKPYTLLLSLDDLLVTSTWDRQHGWRTAKRPGVDYFIAYLSHFYEVVIFTSQPSFHAAPITEKLDPYQFYILYRLFREGTRFVDGHVVKDLSFLNRDLSKVVAIDVHSEHYSLQPENSMIVPAWDGKPGDKGLVALIPFLESIAIFKPDDVRPILQKYYGKDIPTEYAIEEAKHKAVFLKDWREKNKGRAAAGGSSGFTVSSLFGGGSPVLPPTSEPLTYLEQKRREAQAEYLKDQAFVRQNEPEFKRLLEEDLKERERMAKEASGSVAAFVSTILNGPPPPPPPGSSPEDASAPASPKTATDVLAGLSDQK